MITFARQKPTGLQKKKGLWHLRSLSRFSLQILKPMYQWMFFVATPDTTWLLEHRGICCFTGVHHRCLSISAKAPRKSWMWCFPPSKQPHATTGPWSRTAQQWYLVQLIRAVLFKFMCSNRCSLLETPWNSHGGRKTQGDEILHFLYGNAKQLAAPGQWLPATPRQKVADAQRGAGFARARSDPAFVPLRDWGSPTAPGWIFEGGSDDLDNPW